MTYQLRCLRGPNKETAEAGTTVTAQRPASRRENWFHVPQTLNPQPSTIIRYPATSNPLRVLDVQIGKGGKAESDDVVATGELPGSGQGTLQ